VLTDFGLITLYFDIVSKFAEKRRVVAVELQADGYTADIERSLSF
jgi:hypothetical protein